MPSIEDEARASRRPEGLIIRARQPSDVPALTELVNLPGFRFGTMRLPFHSPQEVAGWLEKASATNVELVAVVDGQLVGQAGLYRFTGRQAHAGGLGMGVHDAWTGRAIGTALLAALLDTADNWFGIRRLQLTVYVDNARAIRLYKRFGFVVEGTHRAFALRDGRYVEAHTMARLGGVDPLSVTPPHMKNC